MRIDLSCSETCVPKQALNVPDIYSRFDELSRRRVSEHVRRDAPLDAGLLRDSSKASPDCRFSEWVSGTIEEKALMVDAQVVPRIRCRSPVVLESSDPEGIPFFRDCPCPLLECSGQRYRCRRSGCRPLRRHEGLWQP